MAWVNSWAAVLVALCLSAGMLFPRRASAAPPPNPQQEIAALIEKMGESHMAGKRAHERLIAMGKPAVPALLKAADDAKPLRRWWAISALCTIGDARAIDVLLRRMRDRNPTVRHVAIYHSKAFVRRDPRVAKAAMAMLESPAAGNVEWAVEGLSRVRYRPALPAIKKAGGHPDPMVRARVLQAVQRIDAVGSIPFFAERLRKDTEPTLKRSAIACLMRTRVRDRRTIGALVGALRDRSAGVRVVAFRGLRQSADLPFDVAEPIRDIPREVAVEAVKWWLAHRQDYPAVGKPGRVPTSKPSTRPADIRRKVP